jgi:hypothetical protein
LAARGDALSAAARRDTLEETVGSEVDQVLARLEMGRVRLAGVEHRLN